MLSKLHRPLGHPDRRQALVALLGMLLGLAVFFAVERIVTPRYSFVTPVDEAIPFIPQSWWIYVLFFPFVVVTAAFATASEFNVFKTATMMAFVAGVACFLLFPESVPRPDAALIEDAFLRQRLSRMWRLDMTSNGFPSLHVAVTCLACRMLWATRYRWLVAGTGLLICLSTLTIKQHTLADALGGVLLSVLCSLLVRQRQAGEVFRGHA